ncbi:MAG: DUF4159 domain-containing protein [Gemmatimonadales bacterium]|nr:DUF4159 domain-containing protein [Gemmatimonadales bacterium]NIN11841.1 DUF4159 domain-containing protein [Gemmatimonadales bacterium]NIN50391.1 DUF4159 domain-containing protein [Gemmatimonadales bacterium]NIP07855.1 DUF4159 domain-containing protein [Gemmatimonadales bacterium]NIR02060.1 DUF4159 domain-containing protein [Gemmatimonadales bacterium]
MACAARSVLLVAALALTVSPLEGQRRSRSFPRRPPPENVNFEEFNVPYDGRFAFVRLRFTPTAIGWGGGGGFFGGVNYQWDHDYPRAERHFTRILSEVTTLSPLTNASNILALDDPELFKYPVAYMSEPGYWTLTEAEVEGFRDYLHKGGFVIFDDFVGGHWFNFEEQMRRVLPNHRLVRLDASHPIFHSFFEIESLDQYIHPYRFVPSVFYGVFEDNDPNKRLMVIANYNNDIGESWEWSDTGWIPIDLTNEAYKLGINYIVYAMTH